MASNDLSEPKLPEESRFGLLADALEQSSHKIIHNILSHKAMAECLPQLKKKKPEVLAQLHAILTSTVRKKLKEELEEVMTDFDLKSKLDFIDKLDSEQADLSKGETVWRPTGIPAKDLLAYDMPVLQAHKEALQNYAKELQASNEEEKKKIQTTVEQIEETEKLIESLLAKNEQTIGVLSSIPSL